METNTPTMAEELLGMQWWQRHPVIGFVDRDDQRRQAVMPPLVDVSCRAFGHVAVSVRKRSTRNRVEHLTIVWCF